MTIHIPDPNPGRCVNVRHKSYSDGYVEAVRCLDYEGTQHVCEFPPFTHVVSMGGGSSSYKLQPPKPWVKPDAAR